VGRGVRGGCSGRWSVALVGRQTFRGCVAAAAQLSVSDGEVSW
jgi:hypothetical protein